MEAKIRTFLVDRYRLLRHTLRCFLEYRGEGTLAIVGEAATASEAVAGILEAQPDLVLLDLSLPDFDAFTAMAQMKIAKRDVKIIAVTEEPEQKLLLAFLEAGGLGYVHKSAEGAELLQAVRQVMDGEIFLSVVGVQVMASRYLSAGEEPKREDGEAPPDVLSPRERQVLCLFSRGYSSREIGEELYLSANTVDTYRRRISEKLQINSRVELVAYAVKHQIFGEL